MNDDFRHVWKLQYKNGSFRMKELSNLQVHSDFQFNEKDWEKYTIYLKK